MAYELVQQIIKDLRIRRIFLRLFYDGTPLPFKATRPFSYFVDTIGVEIFGEIDDVTSEISEKLNTNIEDIHAYLTETEPLPPKVEPKSYVAGDTESQLVSFGRVQPTQVSEFERGIQGEDGKDGAGISEVTIVDGELVVELDKPTSTDIRESETVNLGVVKGDSISAVRDGDNLVVTQTGGDGTVTTISDDKVVGDDGKGVEVSIATNPDGVPVLTVINIDKTGATTEGATAGLSGADGKDGSDGQSALTAFDTTAWLVAGDLGGGTPQLGGGIAGVGGVSVPDIISTGGQFSIFFNGQSTGSGDFIKFPGTVAQGDKVAETQTLLIEGTQLDLIQVPVDSITAPSNAGSSFGVDQIFARVVLDTNAVTGPGINVNHSNSFGFTATVSITNVREPGDTFGDQNVSSSYIKIKNVILPKGASGPDGAAGTAGTTGNTGTAGTTGTTGTTGNTGETGETGAASNLGVARYQFTINGPFAGNSGFPEFNSAMTNGFLHLRNDHRGATGCSLAISIETIDNQSSDNFSGLGKVITATIEKFGDPTTKASIDLVGGFFNNQTDSYINGNECDIAQNVISGASSSDALQDGDIVVLSFVRGGQTGAGITGARLEGTNLVFDTLNADGSTGLSSDLGNVKGSDGAAGTTGTTGNTGNSGTTGAGVTGVTISPEGVLEIVIQDSDGNTSGVTAGVSGPKGDDGAAGTTGTTGNTGETGTTGNTGNSGTTGGGVSGASLEYGVIQTQPDSGKNIVNQQHSFAFNFTIQDGDGNTFIVECPETTGGFTYNSGVVIGDGGIDPQPGLLYTESSSEYEFSGGDVTYSIPSYAIGSTATTTLEQLDGGTSDLYFILTTGNSSDRAQIAEGISMDTATGRVGIKFGLELGHGISFSDGSFLGSKNELVTSVNGSTGDVLTIPSQVAHFTIQASSSISTGAKTSALHRIPYSAKITEVGIRTGNTGGITASFRKIRNQDIFDMTEGISYSSLIGTVNAATAAFGATATINSIDGPNYVYMNIDAIASGITLVQGFMEYIRFDGSD